MDSRPRFEVISAQPDQALIASSKEAFKDFLSGKVRSSNKEAEYARLYAELLEACAFDEGLTAEIIGSCLDG